MRRSAAAVLIFVFAVSIFIAPATSANAATTARRCKIMEPMVLRGSYLRSEVVVVGKVGEPGKWIQQPQAEGADARYVQFTRRTPVIVEENIKGGYDTVSITEHGSRYIAENEAEKREFPADFSDLYSSLENNKERRLFFLRKTDVGSYYENYTDHRLKGIESKHFDTYVTRLRELHAIYSSDKLSKEAVVEWLVTMAEDPITRYEGAQELHRALQNAFLSAENEKEEDETTYDADEETIVHDGPSKEKITDVRIVRLPVRNWSDTQSAVDVKSYNGFSGDRDFAKVLSAAQKERLVQAFLAIRFNYKMIEAPEDEDAEESEEPAYADPSDILNIADQTLLDAIVYLRDGRVTARVIGELPEATRHDAGQASELVRMLAVGFNDEKFDMIMENFSQVAYGSSTQLIEDESVAEDVISVKAPGETYTPVKTYGQRRTELLQQIVARGNVLVAKR